MFAYFLLPNQSIALLRVKYSGFVVHLVLVDYRNCLLLAQSLQIDLLKKRTGLKVTQKKTHLHIAKTQFIIVGVNRL